MYGYIYRTTNLINSMFYIGQHKGEFESDYYGSGKCLNYTINKYSRDNFKLEVICYVDDREQANLLERRYIRENRIKFGRDMMYNITDGGEGFYGKHTPESREKIRLARLGKTFTEEIRKKISESNKEKVFSIEYRKKLSEASKGRKKSSEHCENISLSQLGKKQTSEHIRNKILARLGRKYKIHKMEVV